MEDPREDTNFERALLSWHTSFRCLELSKCHFLLVSGCVVSQFHTYAWVTIESHSSVVRAPAAKVGGPGFDSRGLPWVFFSLPAGLLMLMG